MRLRRQMMAGAGPTPNAYLDTIVGAPLPMRAYGLRKLISTATKAVTVRNSTTGVSTDIGFVGDSLDFATLNSTFTGLQNVQISRWWDQVSGGTLHNEQATVARMPAIVEVGVPLNLIRFNNVFANSLLATTGNLPMGTPYWHIYARRKFDAVATRMFTELSANASGANPQAAMLYSAAANRLYAYSQNGAGASRQGFFDCFNTMQQGTTFFDRSIVGAGEMLSWINGVSAPITPAGGSTEQTGNFTAYPAYLGNRADLSLPAVMDITAYADYNANTAPYRTLIEALIGAAP